MAENKYTLNSEGITNKAMLIALDEAQKGMTAEEKEAQNRRINSREEIFTVSSEDIEKNRAAVRLAQYLGKTVEEGEEDRQKLADAAEEAQSPGLANLLALLGTKDLKQD